MTEEAWLTCDDAADLVRELVRRSTGDDSRLWQYVILNLDAIEANTSARLVERWRGGTATAQELMALRDEAWTRCHRRSGGGYSMGRKPVHVSPATQRARVIAALDVDVRNASTNVTRQARHLLQRIQPVWIRCLFSNPFRPVTFSASWRTSTAVALAEAMYADQAFDRLPILADALQDAGCEDAAVLDHCRGGGPHVRGCWVVDHVLEKT